MLTIGRHKVGKALTFGHRESKAVPVTRPILSISVFKLSLIIFFNHCYFLSLLLFSNPLSKVITTTTVAAAPRYIDFSYYFIVIPTELAVTLPGNVAFAAFFGGFLYSVVIPQANPENATDVVRSLSLRLQPERHSLKCNKEEKITRRKGER